MGKSKKKGGAMMGMRSGFKGMVGQKGGKKKNEPTFMSVLGWVVLVFVIGVVIWSLGGV